MQERVELKQIQAGLSGKLLVEYRGLLRQKESQVAGTDSYASEGPGSPRISPAKLFLVLLCYLVIHSSPTPHNQLTSLHNNFSV